MLAIRRLPCITLALGLLACSGETSTGSSNDGSVEGVADGSGGSASGGDGNGGSSRDGGSDVGGSGTGGSTSSGGGGGTSSGGTSSGGTSSGGSATGGTGAGGTGATNGVCQPILNQAGLDTGFDSCSNGAKLRRAALQCPTERTSTTSPCTDPSLCSSDADCTDQPNGYCANAHNLTGYCGCYYGCQSDSDCAAGSLCECGVVVGQCVPATCTTNDDCASNYGCVATKVGISGTVCNNGYPSITTEYVCQTSQDTCLGDGDCPAGGGAMQGVCILDGAQRACGLICLPTPTP